MMQSKVRLVPAPGAALRLKVSDPVALVWLRMTALSAAGLPVTDELAQTAK
jgi:hypothetical protein